jgi:hypothetical protein
MSSHFSLNPKDKGRVISDIRLAAFRPNHVHLIILYSLCYIPDKYNHLFIFDATDKTRAQGAREIDAEERFEPAGTKLWENKEYVLHSLQVL